MGGEEALGDVDIWFRADNFVHGTLVALFMDPEMEPSDDCHYIDLSPPSDEDLKRIVATEFYRNGRWSEVRVCCHIPRRDGWFFVIGSYKNGRYRVRVKVFDYWH